MNIYRDGNGVGECLELLPGSIFGEQPFRHTCCAAHGKLIQCGECDARMGDEQINDAVGGAAHCEEPSIVGILTTDVLEARTCCSIVPSSAKQSPGCICRPNLWQSPHCSEDPALRGASARSSVTGRQRRAPAPVWLVLGRPSSDRHAKARTRSFKAQS